MLIRVQSLKITSIVCLDKNVSRHTYQDAIKTPSRFGTVVLRQYQESAMIDYGRVTIDTVELRQREDLTRYQQDLIRRTTNW